jgi:anti-sigma factor RsiW
MTIHPDLWLDAYLDGELDAVHSKQVEAHLNECADCRKAIEERKALSALLLDEPVLEACKPASRFTSEVALQLTRRPYRRDITGIRNLAWLGTPVALLLVAVFIFTAGLVQTVVDAFPGARATLEQLVASTASLDFIQGGALVADSVDTLRLMASFAIPEWNVVTFMAALVLTGVLYCCWMVGWLTRNRHSQHMAQISNCIER